MRRTTKTPRVALLLLQARVLNRAYGDAVSKNPRDFAFRSGNDERALVVCVRQTPARMEPATQAHDVLAATLIALVSIFAFVLGVSGLKRRARKFAKNAPSKAR